MLIVSERGCGGVSSLRTSAACCLPFSGGTHLPEGRRRREDGASSADDNGSVTVASTDGRAFAIITVVPLLAVKLLLAPSFVVGASLAARRFGARVGGLIAGLPLVAGPILLAYALAHGRAFAAGAAAGTLLGLVSLIAFILVYAHLAGRVSWVLGLLAGWFAFALATLAFSTVVVPAAAALAIAGTALLGGLALLPRPAVEPSIHPAPPSWDLPLRAVCALALVLALTAIAGWLGSQLSGLLAPFPIIATVLATFTHNQHGTDELLRLLRGLVSGFAAFALFCFVLAISLRHVSVAAAFALASALALSTQAAVLVFARSDTAPNALPEH
jgi:hypothetical protein